jgi:hypothetical protein
MPPAGVAVGVDGSGVGVTLPVTVGVGVCVGVDVGVDVMSGVAVGVAVGVIVGVAVQVVGCVRLEYWTWSWLFAMFDSKTAIVELTTIVFVPWATLPNQTVAVPPAAIPPTLAR